MPEELPHQEIAPTEPTNEPIEARWWDPRVRGTLGSYAIKTAMVGVMLTVVGNQWIDHSRDTVSTVVDNSTEQIKHEIQAPMTEVKGQAQEAASKVAGIERDLTTLKQWLHTQFGIDFKDPKSTKKK